MPRHTEIALVRHGRSAHVESRWIDIEGVRRWMIDYDAAEIAHEHPPPPTLVTLARSANLIVSSDLPRAVASAALLAGTHSVEANSLFRESPLESADAPMPALGGVRLPVRAWGLVWGVRWLRASRRGLPPPGADASVLARAEDAAAWLEDKAEAGGLVLVVTHATFRTLLAAALTRRGWRPPPQRPFREWSVWSLRREQSAEWLARETQ